MNHKLISFGPSLFQVQAEITGQGNELFLRYHLEGPLKDLLLAPLNSSHQFKDGLWQHTCFEFFVKDPKATNYTEFNFSPSGDYAVYFFKNYRERDLSFTYEAQPQIKARLSEASFDLEVKVPLLKGDYSLTAVIEDQKKVIQYFALAHKKEKPDFHDPASFIGSL